MKDNSLYFKNGKHDLAYSEYRRQEIKKLIAVRKPKSRKVEPEPIWVRDYFIDEKYNKLVNNLFKRGEV